MNWDDAKYFLAVARSGQMLAAANRLGVSQAKLSRRLASLEQSMGTKLVLRSTSGCELTPQGIAMMEVAEKIEFELQEVRTSIKEPEREVSGTVRIGTPDGFGLGFLAPKIVELTNLYPNLRVQLVPVPRSFSLSQREADIAIMVDRPSKGRLYARKLTDYTLGLYASKSYLENFGSPDDGSDLKNHKLVGYVEDLIFSPVLNYTRHFSNTWDASLEVSSAVGQFEAVKAGAGIGILHRFMARQDADLVMILPHLNIERSYWTVLHENMKNVRRVRVVADFLEAIVRKNQHHF
ncbi:MAG: LysR family transcriptional regulator [Nitratireductor sp.]